jgi:hypothetical protein
MDNSVTMLDENGRQVKHEILAEKNDSEGVLYLLVEAQSDKDAEPEALILKCISDTSNDHENDDEEEMLLEHVDETHESFGLALELFADEFDDFGIEI